MENFILSTFVLSAATITLATGIQSPPTIGDLKIAGGTEATDGEIPYQIMLKRNGNFRCGGSLIEVNGTQFVLTAAHCVFSRRHIIPPSSLTVIAGEVDPATTSGNEQTRNIIRVVAHKHFYPPALLDNDIALLAIDEPFIVNKYVSPIALPEQNQVTTGELIVSGYGTNNPFGITVAPYLKHVRLTVVNNLFCKLLHLPRRVIRSMLCAGKLVPGRNTCAGDSGGPMKAVNGSYVAGIVSWGTICGLPTQPGVNTKVSHFVNWIEQQAASMNLTGI